MEYFHIHTLSAWLDAWRNDPDAASVALITRQQALLTVHQAGEMPEWIFLTPIAELTLQIEQLLACNHSALPLFGVPYAVKDNIDVAGMPTTAGCEEFRYFPTEDAFVVKQLRAAGAICLGKTNLDQFAMGLNGTRTPFGQPSCVFNANYVSGGSSSGSAVAVAKGQVAFTLGTDTAGSGRVPAGFNNLVGLKPTRGLISARGVVPACRSLDCVSIFAANIDEAEHVLAVAGRYDADDVYARKSPIQANALHAAPRLATFSTLEWFGDTLHAQAWHTWRSQLVESTGLVLAEIDPQPFLAMAALLYGGPWVAERLAAIETFVDLHAEDIHPVVRTILLNARQYTAVDVFKAEYQRKALLRQIAEVLAPFDALVLPTTAIFPTIEAVRDEPVQRNTELGHYTNFVNLADLAALAIPVAFRTDGLPFGVTLIGATWSDSVLARIARQLLVLPTPLPITHAAPLPNEMALAVVGAHLSGMPLNVQLTSRSARLLKVTATTPSYRLYALNNTVPEKPGLVFDQTGASIAVEVWAMPRTAVADFLQDIPAPLGLGRVKLVEGDEVTGFICEPRALSDATDITQYGGWRAYLQSKGK